MYIVIGMGSACNIMLDNGQRRRQHEATKTLGYLHWCQHRRLLCITILSALCMAATTSASAQQRSLEEEASDAVLVLLNDADTATAEWAGIHASSAAVVSAARQTYAGMPDNRDASNEAAFELLFKTAMKRTFAVEDRAAIKLHNKLVELYDRTPYPSPKVGDIAIRSLCEVMLAAQSARQRALIADKLVSRFGRIELDTDRFPPDIQKAINDALSRLNARSVVTVVVSDDSVPPGKSVELYARGRRLARGGLPLEVRLPVGKSYLLMKSTQSSRPHLYPLLLKPGQNEAALHMNTSLDARVSFSDHIALRCSKYCDADLLALGRRLNVPFVVGVASSALESNGGRTVTLRYVDVKASKTTRKELHKLQAPGEPSLLLSPAPPSFSSLYLLPLGIGQAVQKRYGFAAGYAVVQVALGAWAYSALSRYNTLNANGEVKNERALRTQYMLAGGVFLGSVIFSIAEAVFVGRSLEPAHE